MSAGSEGDDLAPFRLCVFCDAFGAPSMTFVYRQLVGLSDRFDAWVLARDRTNADLFPFEPVVELSKVRASLRDRVERQLRRIPRVTRYSSLSPLVTRAVGGRRTDIIHAHFGPLGLSALDAARRGRIPLVVTFHGYDASKLLRDPAYVRALQPLFGYAQVVCVSHVMRERLLTVGADPGRTVAHHIGVPVERIPHVDRRPVAEKLRHGEDVTFLQVSRFSEKKGQAITLRAFAKITSGAPTVRLVLAGDGATRDACMALARDLGIADSVTFPGGVGEAQVFDLMAAADVFVHHSVTGADGDEEGIPTVIMEAMASGLPVLSTLHAGIPELVLDGRTGYLVAERDVDAFAERMRRVLADDGALGAAGRAHVLEGFDLTEQNRLLEEIYLGALRRAGRPSA